MAQTNEEATTKSLDSTFESIIIDIPQNITFSSASSSSYDTDSSVNSATCCTKHNEHNYMQKPLTQQLPHNNNNNNNNNNKSQDHCHAKATSNLKHSANIDMEDVCFKADHRKSWPIFILMISLLETAVFVYDKSQEKNLPPYAYGIDDNSVFIYRPDRRVEVWRFISYMFLHANWFHLSFNVVVQLFYGIPLEVMHGSLRVSIIYFAGVFAGSLGTSVVESNVTLLGASGGVYAILAANLANLTLNYGQMKYAVAQLYSVVIFVLCDLSQVLCLKYFDPASYKGPAVSYVAHMTGSLAGLTIGLLVLKNFEHRAYGNLIWWLALGIYCAFTIFAIAFNLINTVTAQRMEEEGKVITQHLMHDLGVS